MEIEKAIEDSNEEKTIENLKITIKLLYDDNIICPSTAKEFDLAISALEKQMPKKPIDTKEAWLCPNCKSHIHHEQQLMHCRQCGQLVDWRGENE